MRAGSAATVARGAVAALLAGLLLLPAAATAAPPKPVVLAVIGHAEGDYLDPRSSWVKQREISPAGAVLVRPDRFVAWRSLGGSVTPEQDLRRALSRVLGREALEATH